MGELNTIANALDFSLSSLNQGRRASDKRRHDALASTVSQLKACAPSLPDVATVKAYSAEEIAAAMQTFFDLLMQEDRCSPTLMVLLEQLQAPVTQAVQNRPEFFIEPHNYARRLIKALFVRDSDMLLEQNFQNKPIVNTISAAVKKVIADYKGDDRVFLQAYYEVINA